MVLDELGAWPLIPYLDKKGLQSLIARFPVILGMTCTSFRMYLSLVSKDSIPTSTILLSYLVLLFPTPDNWRGDVQPPKLSLLASDSVSNVILLPESRSALTLISSPEYGLRRIAERVII